MNAISIHTRSDGCKYLEVSSDCKSSADKGEVYLEAHQRKSLCL